MQQSLNKKTHTECKKVIAREGNDLVDGSENG